MSDNESSVPASGQQDWGHKVGLVFAFVLVCMGMLNNLPNIPGLLSAVQSIPGLGGIPRISKFSSEFFFPVVFTVMMIVGRRTKPTRTSLRRNFKIAYGKDLSESEIRTLTYRVLRHMAWLVVDFARIPLFREAAVAEAMTPEDIKVMHDLVAEGKGLMGVGGHIGVFDGIDVRHDNSHCTHIEGSVNRAVVSASDSYDRGHAPQIGGA